MEVNDKNRLTDLLKEIEILSLDLISKGRLNDNTLHEIVIYSTSILWERDIIDAYFEKLPDLKKASLVDVNKIATIVPFNKDDKT